MNVLLVLPCRNSTLAESALISLLEGAALFDFAFTLRTRLVLLLILAFGLLLGFAFAFGWRSALALR